MQVPNIDVDRKYKRHINPLMILLIVGIVSMLTYLVDYVFIKKDLFKFNKPVDVMQKKYKEKKYNQVIEIANDLLKKHKHSLPIYRYLWKSYLYTKQYDLTLKTLLLMEQLTPDSIEIPLGLCTTFRFMEEYEKAKIYCEQAIDINPNIEQAHEQLVQIFIEQKKYNEATDYLDTLSQTQPDNLKRYLLKANIASINQNYAKSAEILEAAKKIYSDVPIIHYYLGKNYINLKKYSRAASNLEEFITSISSKDIDVKLLKDAYTELAYTYEKASMYSNAHRAYKNAACFTMKLKNTDEAVSLIQRAIAATYYGYSGFVSQNDFKKRFNKLKKELEKKCEVSLFREDY